jgi:hypothetical protein
MERTVGSWRTPARRREFLARYFTDSVYEGHREALLDALCGPSWSYSFDVGGDGPDRGHYLIGWGKDSNPPFVFHIQRVEG